MKDLLDLAGQVVADLQGLGADEASATLSRGSHFTMVRRDGRVEQATEATTRALVVSLMLDGRYSSHSTSDLRPEALQTFLARAVDATRYLEPDPDRCQPDLALCGRGSTPEHLDQDDPTWYAWTPEDRGRFSEAMWEALASVCPEATISAASWSADGQSEVVRRMSNGFSGVNRGAWFSAGGDVTLLDENGRRPEAAAFYGARYRSDLPEADAIAAEVVKRAEDRLGAGPIASGSYPLVLANRAAGRLLGAIGGPLGGAALHQHRSCLADKLGERIASPLLTIIDDPTIPRGLGSRPWDGDALRAVPRTILENGVLKSYYLNVYYGRKLDMTPTTGSRSNWIIPPGDRPIDEITAELPRALLVNSFLGGNSNAATGDFSFGIRGTLLEHGKPVRALSEMNLSGNVLDVFDRLIAVGDDPWTWSSVRSPTLVFDELQFSGT